MNGYLISIMHATCPVHLILNLITVLIFGKELKNYVTVYSYVTFSVLGPYILLRTISNMTFCVISV
jgi:hypothetical protein